MGSAGSGFAQRLELVHYMQEFTFRELTEGELFDPNTLSQGTPFTQAAFYGDWQRHLGKRVRRFTASTEGKVMAYFQIIKYPLLSGKSYLYAPYGPVVKNPSDEIFRTLKAELARIAQEENAVFVRLDFTPHVPTETLSKFFTTAPPFTYHSSYFQPRTEWFLPLQKSEYDLLSDMHKHTRYSIRLAGERGVTVEIVTKDFKTYFDSFYALMVETAKRNGFNLHPKKYYEGIFESLDGIAAYLSVARFEDTILAVNLIIVYGGVASHIFGGSSSDERHRMPAYLAQWDSIRHAKLLGCTDYNFGGISTDSGVYKGWEGLTSFKKKFGGRKVVHSDFFDLVTRPLWYHLYNIRKRLKSAGL